MSVIVELYGREMLDKTSAFILRMMFRCVLLKTPKNTKNQMQQLR